MPTSTLPILPTVNLAPVAPLLALSGGQSPTPTYIADGIKELFGDCLRRDEIVWKEIAQTSEVVSNFIQGKQIWQPNYWNNTWSVQPVNHANPNRITAINMMQFYCTEQIKMFCSSNPDLEPIQEFKRKEYKDKVKKAKAVWNYYESRFYTNWFNQQEALHAVISGTYLESVRYDHLKQGTKVFKEIFGEKEVEISPGYSKCYNPDCQHVGTYKDFVLDENTIPSCPNCGSMEITPPESPITQKFTTVTGVQPMQMGDLSLELLPIQACRFDMRVRAEESSWFIYRQIINRNKLQHLLGDAQLPMQDITTDRGLRSLQHVSHAGNTLYGRNNMERGDIMHQDTVLDRFSLSASDVAHIKTSTDEETISGKPIPKGTRLSDLCPDGLTVIGINNMGVILGIYPDVHHSKELATGVYHMRLESGVGRGSEDSVEVQKRFNRFDSQNVRAMEIGATPAHTYIKGAVDQQHVKKIGQPGAIIPINQDIAQAMGSQNVVNQIAPTAMAAQFFSYTYDILNQYRQITSHATNATNAFPGVDNKTAHGAELAKNNADSVFGPTLQVKSEARCATAHNTLNLYNKHFKGVSQYMSFGETEGGQEVGGHVKGEDIDVDIRFTVVRNSEQPKTDFDRQQDFANMLTLVGGGPGYIELKQADPQLLDSLQKAFDLDLGDDIYDCLSDVCEDRLEEALQLFQMGSQTFDMVRQRANQSGVQLPEPPIELLLEGLSEPIILEEPNHALKAKWFMEYLDTPEGYALPKEQRQIVALFVRTHYQMEVQQQGAIAAGFAQAQVIGNQPIQQAQDQQNQQQQAQQHEQNMQANQQQATIQAQQADQAHSQNLASQQQQNAMQQQNQVVQQQHSNQSAVLQSALDLASQHLAPKEKGKK